MVNGEDEGDEEDEEMRKRRRMTSDGSGRRKEVENSGQSEAAQISKRSDTVSYALLAEVNTFHEQRVKDIKSSHQHFLQEQIKFYQRIGLRVKLRIKFYR